MVTLCHFPGSVRQCSIRFQMQRYAELPKAVLLVLQRYPTYGTVLPRSMDPVVVKTGGLRKCAGSHSPVLRSCLLQTQHPHRPSKTTVTSDLPHPLSFGNISGKKTAKRSAAHILWHFLGPPCVNASGPEAPAWTAELAVLPARLKPPHLCLCSTSKLICAKSSAELLDISWDVWQFFNCSA